MSFQELLALILSDNDNLSFSEAAVRCDLVWLARSTNLIGCWGPWSQDVRCPWLLLVRAPGTGFKVRIQSENLSDCSHLS